MPARQQLVWLGWARQLVVAMFTIYFFPIPLPELSFRLPFVSMSTVCHLTCDYCGNQALAKILQLAIDSQVHGLLT